jgi:hypothetical protein
MLGKSALGSIENYVLLMDFRGSGTSEARPDALQCAMKRGQTADLELDFGLSRHAISQAPPKRAFSH